MVQTGTPGVLPMTDKSGQLRSFGDNEKQIPTTGSGAARQLVEHEAALRRLEELQQTMIGGERAGDVALQQELSERRKKAEDKNELLLRASRALEEDDGIIEGIFNSLTGMCVCVREEREREKIGDGLS